MIVTIMQPAYLPWLGFFHRIDSSDLFIVLDHVQMDKNSKTKFANRNKIRTADGWAWLTVPVRTRGLHGRLNINELEITDDQRWGEKHWAGIAMNYRKTPHFKEHAAFFEEVYTRDWVRLVDLTEKITGYLLQAFGIRTPLKYSSTMGEMGSKDELILNLCREAGAKTYVSGPFGRDYLDENRFAGAGIRLVYHDYAHPVYPQAYPGFEPCMSAIDLLFNCGPKSLDILRSGQSPIKA